MARATFDRAGRKVVIDDNPLIQVSGEVGNDESTDSTNNGTDGNVEIVDGSVNGKDSGEVGSHFVETGETIRGTGYIEPGTVAEPTGKRPRKPRGPNKPKPAATAQASANVISTNLTKVLLSLHTMGAALLSEPTLEITEDEAELISEAVKEVAKAYDFTQIFNPKIQTLIDLGIVVMTVHGPRVVKIYHRHTHKPGSIQVMRPASTGD